MDDGPGEDDAAVRAAIDRVVTRGWFVLGPEVDAFEAEFAAASGASHAIGVGNGTDAIALLLRALGVRHGDEVIVPALTAAYTGLAVLLAGGTPVFAGTRVPVQTLLDYLQGGESINDFLEGFPSVRREQVIELLDQARDLLVAPYFTTEGPDRMRYHAP